MVKYIDIEAAKEAARRAECDANYDGRRFDAECVENAIDFTPAANVGPIVHGEWIDKPGAYRRWQSWCSACGKHSGIGGIGSNRHKPFCPNCGAKMRI